MAHRAVAEQARREAFYDALTKLPNRALGLDLLRRAIARTRRQGERRFAALLVDIDHFNAHNDAMGHGVGGELAAGAPRRDYSRVDQRGASASRRPAAVS